MNKFSKAAMLVATLTTVGSLAACQSTQGPMHPHAHHMMKGGPGDKDMMKRPPRLSPEQRAERKAEFEALQKACEGRPVGQALQVKLGDRTINGTCEIRFTPAKMDDHMAPPTPPAPVAQQTAS